MPLASRKVQTRFQLQSTGRIPQGDPISMFAAATALELWLESLAIMPPSPGAEAWVFVDDRLQLSALQCNIKWAQEAFLHTTSWDASQSW